MERRKLLKIIGLIVLFNFVSYPIALFGAMDCMSYKSSDIGHISSVSKRMPNIDKFPFTIYDWWAGYGLLAEVVYVELLLRT